MPQLACSRATPAHDAGTTGHEACSTLLLQLRLQLPVSSLFVIGLDALAILAARVAGARAVVLEGAAEQRGAFLIPGIAFHRGAEACNRAIVLRRAPLGKAHVEAVIRIGAIALEGLGKARNRRSRFLLARLRRAQNVV